MNLGQCSAVVSGLGAATSRRLIEAIVRNPFLNGQVIRLDGALSTPLTDMSPTGKP